MASSSISLVIQRARRLRDRRGASVGAHYLRQARRQGFVCAVCHCPEELCQDHSHSTGKCRGLLCRACNLALGAIENLSPWAWALGELREAQAILDYILEWYPKDLPRRYTENPFDDSYQERFTRGDEVKLRHRNPHEIQRVGRVSKSPKY